MLAARRSCALLSRGEMEQGKVPTTPTTAAIIAGIQVQEAIKYLHGLESIAGQGFIFDGTSHQSYLVRYTRKPDCPAHDADAPVAVLSWRTETARVGDLLERVRADLGREAVIETGRDLLASLHCGRCGQEERALASLGKVTLAQGRCPQCGQPRAPRFYHVIDGHNPELHDLTFDQIGIPPWDVLCGRAGLEQRFYEFGGDRSGVLGPLAGAREQ
jgi:adenylyltransferase/sulfurtransferase